MFNIERFIIEFVTLFVDWQTINDFLSHPQNTAIILGALIAISGAVLGSFLLLRGMALTSDAISHTVLLGIVVAFLVGVHLFNMEPDLSSPWLIIGAALSGVGTVVLTEIIQRSGLVKQDAALGLAFPFLFAVAVILVSRYADNVHLDTDAVLVGEIGVAWANTNSHCLENCETIIITPDSELAEVTRQCTNCRELGISPRDEGAVFQETCRNCGTYSPAQAWQARLIDERPTLIFWPKAITVMLLLTALTVGFVAIFYKELKLSTFDSALANALGFRPAMLHYALMILVSLVAVGAFDAVGSILVVAFFIIPPATAYLLTDRLAGMLILSPLIGTLGVYWGYGLARGDFLGLFNISTILKWLNQTFDMGLVENWNSSISASMVLMMFFFFLLGWILSPKYGLIATMVRRLNSKRQFNDQVVLGHIANHVNTHREEDELNIDTLHEHMHWTPAKMKRVITRLRMLQFIQTQQGIVRLTPRGEIHLLQFQRDNLPHVEAG